MNAPSGRTDAGSITGPGTYKWAAKGDINAFFGLMLDNVVNLAVLAGILVAGFGFPAPQDDWNKFDTPALRGIKDTAPYFHNNSADTLEEVVDHYIEFFKRVKANTAPGAPIPPVATTDGINFDRAPLPEERESLLAYLRKL